MNITSFIANLFLFIYNFIFICLVVFGEDVAFGGVFRCSVGLREKYGISHK